MVGTIDLTKVDTVLSTTSTSRRDICLIAVLKFDVMS